MDARLASDVDTDFFGTVTITTAPEGAKVFLNNQPLLDEKGHELTTPVTFDTAWVKSDKGRLEKVPVRVDTTIDVGHKLQVQFPDKPDMPKYATQIQRQMWVCNKKDESEIKRLARDHSPQLECNYTYKKAIDFNALAAYIKGREEERARVEKKNAEMRRKMLELREGKDALDPAAAKALQEAAGE